MTELLRTRIAPFMPGRRQTRKPAAEGRTAWAFPTDGIVEAVRMAGATSGPGGLAPAVFSLSYWPDRFTGMIVRYRYRIDPTSVQCQALAKAFGCAGVVYNDRGVV